MAASFFRVVLIDARDIKEDGTKMPDLIEGLTESLAELIGQHHVPGAVLAVAQGDRCQIVHSGMANLNSGLPVTADTLFQIGSITKLYTATLALQMVDKGLLALDQPVVEILPDFQLGDKEASRQITLAHLLSHTSGMDGDLFIDAGRGDDRFARFVTGMKDAPSVLPFTPPAGAPFSYANAAFVVVARMIEQVSGMGWDKALRSFLIRGLGTKSFSTLPEQAMRYATAIGHLGTCAEDMVVTPVAFLSPANAAAGSYPMASASDVVAFVRMHLALGVGPDGTRLLSEARAREMQRVRVACPPDLRVEALGLGFMKWSWGTDGWANNPDVWGHDGATIGQASWLRVHEPSGTIFVLLTNGGDGKGMVRKLLENVFPPLCNVSPPPVLQANPDCTPDLAALCGTYGKSSETLEVREVEGALEVAHVPSPGFALLAPGAPLRLAPVRDDLFITQKPGQSEPVTYHFLKLEGDTRPSVLHTNVQAYSRQDG